MVTVFDFDADKIAYLVGKGALAAASLAMAPGRADSHIMHEFIAKYAARDYSPAGRIDNMRKELDSVQVFAMKTPLPMTGQVRGNSSLALRRRAWLQRLR